MSLNKRTISKSDPEGGSKRIRKNNDLAREDPESEDLSYIATPSTSAEGRLKIKLKFNNITYKRGNFFLNY